MVKLLCCVLLAAPVVAAPNVIVILADDLGYGDLGAYGSNLNRTPNIDALANSGQRLTSAYSATSCTASRAALMTGAYAWRVGLPKVLVPGSIKGLNKAERTLPEYFRALGYRTGMVGKWHLGHLPKFLPRQHGFDMFAGVPYSNDMTPLPLIINDDISHNVPLEDQKYLTNVYTVHAINFMRDSVQAGKPFLLYFSHTKPHAPHSALPEFLALSSNGVYGAEVQEIDWSLGQITQELTRLGIRNDTIIVFLSDNGATATGSNAPLRGFKTETPLEGAVRVPMIWNWPGRIPAGKNAKPATIMDVLPTLVKAAGGAVAATPKIDGKDIMPMLTSAAPSPNVTLFYFGLTEMVGVRAGDWKLHLKTGRLFNLEMDPRETRNVAWGRSGIVTNLKRKAAAMARDLGYTYGTCKNCRPPGR